MSLQVLGDNIKNAFLRAVIPPTVDERLLEIKRDITLAPSGLLVLFAFETFNLGNDPIYPILSESVKKQILAAAHAHKIKDGEEKGVIELGEGFEFEKMKLEDLVVLLRILKSYHAFESQFKQPQDLFFHKHVLLIETYLETLAWEGCRGEQALDILRREKDPILKPVADSLEKILARKAEVPSPSSFEANPKIVSLFNMKKPRVLKALFDLWGSKPLLAEVESNYKTFLIWVKTMSALEGNESDPIMKQALLRRKSVVQERFYQKHFDLLYHVIDVYPDLFKSVLGRRNHLAVLDGGSSIILKRFQEKGKIPYQPIVCSSYEDFRAKLEAIAHEQNGEWMFAIRCQFTSGRYDVHQSGVFLEKRDGKCYANILDSGFFDIKTSGYVITGILSEVIPNSEVFYGRIPRQRDNNNCSFFMFRDFIALARNKEEIIEFLRQDTEMILDIVGREYGKDVATYWIQNTEEVNRRVHISPEIPLEFVTPTQSLSKVKESLANPKGPSTPEKVEAVRRKVASYTIIELSPKSANFGAIASGYTKLKAMKYRLHMATETVSA